MTDMVQNLEPHLPRLRRFARTLVQSRPAAEDLVQSTILRALEKRHLYRIDTNLRGWLMTIMHNEHVTAIRRQARTPTLVSDSAIEQLSTPTTQEFTIELHEIRRAVALLPKSQRDLLLMHCVDDLTYEEIATRLGLPMGTVQSRIWRARAALRTLLLANDRKLGLAHSASSDAPGTPERDGRRSGDSTAIASLGCKPAAKRRSLGPWFDA